MACPREPCNGGTRKLIRTISMQAVWQTVSLVALLLLSTVAAHGASNIQIPRISTPPRLADFENMAPHGSAQQMAKVAGFIQQFPSDGQPGTQRTEVYLGYDSANLYLVWVCWDSNPHAIRGHMTRREAVTPPDDDYIELTLDTFHDQRHAFLFNVNPHAMQADALWTENGGADYSFDTVWDSHAQINSQGFVIWMSIPFRSLRFHPTPDQVWGVTLMRYIARNDEADYWPRVSSRISGRLNQEGTMSGFENVSPSRNLQFIPYTSFRNFRALDTRDPIQPRFNQINAQGKIGLDSKIVFHDSLVLDTTINPDFAQVESDEPQNTVNQRFEVFFPEKRPFFLENANFFGDTNTGVYDRSRLLFTRRIGAPTFGSRLTGKQGPWNLGFFVADDRSPGLTVPDFSPLRGKRAYFAVGRVSHDFGRQNSIGTIYTDREFDGNFNRVGGFDTSFRLGKNWTSWYRGVVSSTLDPSLGYLFGQNHEAALDGKGRRFYYEMVLQDITPHFLTETGFVPRTDIRSVSQYYHFYWRPEGKHLILYGPELQVRNRWDHNNVPVQQVYNADWAWDFRPNVVIAPIVAYQVDVLRPVEFPGLPNNRKFVQDLVALVFKGSPWRTLTFNSQIVRDGAVLIDVPARQFPITADETAITQTLTLKPTTHLEIDNTYILDRVLNGAAHHAAFNYHILRSKWNYQFTPSLSLRMITQYNGLLANTKYSSLKTTKNLNFDFLITYLVHPGTAVYVGYNSNLENLIPGLCNHLSGSFQCDPKGDGLVRSNSFINDGRQLFVKLSYLIRP